jgi:Amt family ammonium transporter
MFCAATASIVSGALAERIKLWPFLIFVIVLTGFIYPLTASWQWGGGWLSEAGFSDFAGSTVVHACGAGRSAGRCHRARSASGQVQGRQGQPDAGFQPRPRHAGHVHPVARLVRLQRRLAAGHGLGGDVADVSRIFANTNMAAAAGAVAALILTQLFYGKADLTMVLNGALAGLVSITAEPLAPSLGLALVIGAIGG